VNQRGTPGATRPIPLRPLAATNSSFFARRLRWTYVGIAIVFVALVTRLAFIQVADGSYYSKLSVEQVRTDVSIPPLRGAMYDRNGSILAISSPTSLVVADDFQIKHPATEAAALSPFLGVPASTLEPLLSRHSGYVVLDASLSLSQGHALAQQYFPGIDVLSSSKRTYPNGELATSLIGGINASAVGSAGLEYQYQGLLGGQAGLERIFASPSGIALPSSHVTVLRKATTGKGMELSIDTALQFVTEQALGQQLRATGGLTGVAIVMDVKTGQILANASLVNTAVSAGVLGPISNWSKTIGVPGIKQTINDLAFTQTYEPGSVFKIVPFSAALNAGTITPTSHFSVPYSVTVDGRVFHDAERHGIENLTTTNILAQSSNIGTYEIASRVGKTGLLRQVQLLGFGTSTGLSYPGESPGLLVNAAQWSGSDLAALPIGQVDAVTPIEVLDAYNSIANQGVYVAPKLVMAKINADGTLVPTPKSSTHRALSPTVASQLTTMLEQVVLDGTGTNALIPGYQVAGKTGTSQIPTPGRASYITGAYNASFVGFAPANHPVLSMIVVVQRPQTVIFGGSVAAPVFQRVMSYALHHYGVPATGPVTITKNSKATVASDVT